MGLIGRPDENADEAPKAPFKRTRVQCGCTVVTLLLNFIVLFGGGLVLVMAGSYSEVNLKQTANGYPVGPPFRAVHFCIVLGVFAVLASILGCFGFAKKPKTPCVAIFQLVTLVLLGIFTAFFAMLFVTEDVVGTASKEYFDVAVLSSRDADVLLKLYLQFERLYNYCRPADHRNALWAGAMTDPSGVDTACVESATSSLGGWGQSVCLGSASDWDAARLAGLQSCHDNLRNHSLYLRRAYNDSPRSAWLFCACSQALPQWLDDNAGTPAKAAGGVAFGLLFLLLLLSCVLCCGFKKKKKKKKKAPKPQMRTEGSSLLGERGSVEMGAPKVNHIERGPGSCYAEQSAGGVQSTTL